EPVLASGLAHPGDAFVVQIGADGLAVTAQVPGDRGDRPTLPPKRVRVDVFLPCQHGKRGLLREMACGQRPPSSKEPHPLPMGATGWGNSVSRTGEIHLSAIREAASASLS